jgi:hypothetical protein
MGRIDKLSMGSRELLPASDIHNHQRLRHIERSVSSQPQAGDGNLKFAEDELLTQSMHHQSFKGHTFSLGQVLGTFPYCHWYKVRLDVGGSVLKCCTISSLAPRLGGVREVGQIAPNTVVLVYCPIELDHGIIIGCLPTRGDGSSNYADMICQGSAVGAFREKYYSTIPERFARNGDIINFGSHTPLDALASGEWGIINDLGGGVFVDPMMSYLRASESSGLWLFHLDNLTRLSGYNYDFRSCMSEEIIRNDDGEGFHYQGFTPYIWEALGAIKAGADPWDFKEDDKALLESDLRAKGEPKTPDQIPVYRLEEFRGYVGQAYFRQVSVPKAEGGDIKKITNQNLGENRGVFREQLGLDGSWAVMSAHSIHIGKRALIPDVRRIRANEDPEGDDLATGPGYRPAGYHGERTSFNEHRITDTVRSSEAHPQWNAAALSEILAYATNWKSWHPFYYHLKDYVHENSKIKVQSPPPFSMLSKRQWLPLPDPQELQIDHRYSALLYALASSINLNSDGSLSLRGGQGCELRFAGGSAIITAPGDFIVQTGRSAITYAGDDAVIKAYNSVDISATNHDVHVKAQKNLEMLGGNGGTGRVLIESKSSGGAQNVDLNGRIGEDISQGGMFFKSAGDIVSYAESSSYLRTGFGQITVDAGGGQGVIRTYASSIINHLNNIFEVSVGGLSGGEPVVHYMSSGRVQLGSALIVGGSASMQADVTVRGNISAVGGEVGPIRPDSRAYELANNYHTQRDQEIQKASSDAAKDLSFCNHLRFASTVAFFIGDKIYNKSEFKFEKIKEEYKNLNK